MKIKDSNVIIKDISETEPMKVSLITKKWVGNLGFLLDKGLKIYYPIQI